MLVPAAHFKDEPLLPLQEAGRKMNPPRTRVSLWTWHSQGQLNQSSQPVFLRVCKLPSGYHTSLEEIERYIRAVTSITLLVEIVGGTLHGMRVHIPDTDEVLTAGDLSDQLGGKVVPADECYVPIRFIGRDSRPRTFLVHKELPDGRERVIRMLESE